MRCVDTHCHLQMPKFDEDRNEALERALDCLDWLVIVGDDLEGSQAACALTRERVYAVVGFHPYSAGELNDTTEEALRELTRNPRTVGIGEIGLDYYNEYTPRALQQPTFERQLALAVELQMPVVIHSRDAQEDTLAILRDYVIRLPSCIMHCFGGDAFFAEQCLDLGCHISFAGNVTYPKAEALRAAARVTPQERLLVETDAPYLAPQCHRGKRCEPSYVLHTLEFIAKLKDIDIDELGEQVTANACSVFNISSE
ncbi:MAG: TatD family hydrolase [Candidatus Hydrogenedentes bacterium]|nr:TatD family hydrolase [Candidatus Hydrogenedentota bacterium]